MLLTKEPTNIEKFKLSQMTVYFCTENEILEPIKSL